MCGLAIQAIIAEYLTFMLNRHFILNRKAKAEIFRDT